MSNQIASPELSYSDLERLGWPEDLINDYQAIRQQLTPQKGTEADPNDVYRANLNGMYVDTNLGVLWYNPTAGALTGWIAL